ncbi:MAG TPA: pitrilysin family protein [Hyphomicrobiaceae bacterium]|nr:pitrilysin family protein [Hyphomicrobiaceae bacterium]
MRRLHPRSNLSRTMGLVFLMTLLATLTGPGSAWSQVKATEMRLANGMQIIVIPDNRAPVVTHMVWYRVGRADEPAGMSGVAHFLEHLMFKSTEKIAVGEFSKIVSRLGGNDNAFTGQDVTAYFQRVHKDRLEKVMGMEADRMVNLRLTEKEVLTERDVILEERRTTVESKPGSILGEQMDAALYLVHPYGQPVIGWENEIARLTPQNAIDFYKRFYAPNNAILVVSGDVTPEHVKALAEKTYGLVPANPAVMARPRAPEPLHRVARRVELRDPRAGRYSLHRYYLAPSYASAEAGEAEALELLMKIMASGGTSRLYKKLVADERIAANAGGGYGGYGRDSGKISFTVVAADGVPLSRAEASLDELIADIRAKGITEAELARAKTLYMADYVYLSDNQYSLAQMYGWAITVGRTLKDVEEWPARINRVTLDDIKKVAAKYLDIRRSVTGTMLPEPASPDARRVDPAVPPKNRS